MLEICRSFFSSYPEPLDWLLSLELFLLNVWNHTLSSYTLLALRDKKRCGKIRIMDVQKII